MIHCWSPLHTATDGQSSYQRCVLGRSQSLAEVSKASGLWSYWMWPGRLLVLPLVLVAAGGASLVGSLPSGQFLGLQEPASSSCLAMRHAAAGGELQSVYVSM